MPSATRAPAFRHLRLFLTLGGSTKSQLHHAAAVAAVSAAAAEGQKKQNETEAININPHPDGRLYGVRTAHMSSRGGEERGEATCRQGGGSFLVRRGGWERRGGSRSHTELMKPRVWFASLVRFPPEGEIGHENLSLKMGPLRLWRGWLRS